MNWDAKIDCRPDEKYSHESSNNLGKDCKDTSYDVNLEISTIFN